jgi:hypothetical protein
LKSSRIKEKLWQLHQSRNFPLFQRKELFNQAGLLTIAFLALTALSNLPKANSLGHFWKIVDKDCYEQCKRYHGAKGIAAFGICYLRK